MDTMTATTRSPETTPLLGAARSPGPIRSRGTAFAAVFLAAVLSGCGVGTNEPAVDLDAVLEVTEGALLEVDRANPGGEPGEERAAALMDELADVLEKDYNGHVPALHDGLISVAPREDASLVAVADTNGNLEPDPGERPLWQIEVDGENARILATDSQGAVRESGFSGTSLLAGYLLGSMLSRQRAAGVDTRALAGKRPVTAQQARQARQTARSRAGSGSFARGK